jgi:hypothetical protein
MGIFSLLLWTIGSSLLAILINEIFINNYCFGVHSKQLENGDWTPSKFDHIIVYTKMGDVERQEAVRKNMKRLGLKEFDDWDFFQYMDGAKIYGPACHEEDKVCF